MDFRTEWWSKLMVAAMIVIAIIINPYPSMIENAMSFSNIANYALRILAHPFIAIALSTIPVLIVCYFIKVMPDLDYSIWLAFVYMLYLLVRFLIG